MDQGNPTALHVRFPSESPRPVSTGSGLTSTMGSPIPRSGLVDLGSSFNAGLMSTPAPRKRQRKSRGRGLRTKTGCLTCRSRHKKCDEQRPVCGPCSISTRDCVFPDDKLRALGDAAGVVEEIQPSSSSIGYGPGSTHTLPCLQRIEFVPGQVSSPDALIGGSPVPPLLPSAAHSDGYSAGQSPSTTAISEPWDPASNRWLDLLASDAAYGGFALPPGLGAVNDGVAPSERPKPRVGPLGPGDRELLGPPIRPPVSAPDVPPPAKVAAVHKPWQADRDIVLSASDRLLFRHFTKRAALWLDLLDPSKHFSTYATHIALRNRGLMRAILALSARHTAMLQGSSIVDQMVASPTGGSTSSESIQYYYETLQFVQNNLQHHTYARSEQLLATALIISTYEMLDEADGRGNWQRHLKGVFWIQRSQDVHGGSGGLRQAVWWAWLRQDFWAAFREKRRCLSFWKPLKDYPDLTEHDMADRSVYLLSQAVNYVADAKDGALKGLSDTDFVAKRIETGDNLLAMLDRWKSFLGPKFRPLPTSSRPGQVFQPIWIHPPQFGVALQVYNFARILILLHRPALIGSSGYQKTQLILSEAVETICGIAMELVDEGCQILSAQCLYGAGLCVYDAVRRERIVSMIEDCEARTGWPMASWRRDLRQIWADADQRYQEQPA